MKKNRVLLIVLSVLSVLVLGLLWRFPYILGSEDRIAYFVRSLLLLGFLLPVAFLHDKASQSLKYGAVWGGVFLVLLIGYSYREDLGSIGQRLKSNLLPFAGMPSYVDGSLSFIWADNGHFLVEALVNGVPVQFMVDTGAGRISLTPQDAQRLGFDVQNLSYREPVQTANGQTFAAPVYLDEVRIGGIVVRNLSALVNKNLSGHSLLGMNFLKRLKGFKIEGDRLTLEAPQS